MTFNNEFQARLIAREAIAVEPGQNLGEFSGLISYLLPRNIINAMEIGTEGGCSFRAWCRVAAPHGLKISLDWQNSGVGRGRWLTPESRAGRDATLRSWAPNVHLVEGNSHEPEQLARVKEVLGDQKLDFLFIDGDHSPAGVAADWNDYSPLVRPGGMVAFHDIKNCDYHRRAGCYVHDFWPTLKATYKTLEFISHETVWGGIGVVLL